MNLEPVKISPFADRAECRKCGLEEHSGYGGFGNQAIQQRYCPGSQELEPEIPKSDMSPLTEAVGEMISAMGPIIVGSRQINICVGVIGEHLHRTCSGCGYEWLTATKDGGAA